MSTPVILHISDMHLGSSSAYEHPESLVQAIESAIGAVRQSGKSSPKYLFCSGDLGSRGDTKSITDARDALLDIASRLEIHRSRIILCPGNHDVDRESTKAQVVASPGARTAGPDHTPQWDGQQFRAYLNVVQNVYGFAGNVSLVHGPPTSDRIATPGEIFSLHYFPDDQLVVYSVNSAVLESHDPADRYGYVGKDQLDRFDRVIDDFKRRDKVNPHTMGQVVVVHHPLFAPHDHNPSALRDPFHFMNWLWQHGIDVVLHGHQHFARTMEIRGRDTDLTERAYVCVGAGSVGVRQEESLDKRNTFHLIELTGRGSGARFVAVRPYEFVRASKSWTATPASRYVLEASKPQADEQIRGFGLSKAVARLNRTQQSILRADEVIVIEGADAAFETYVEALGMIEPGGEFRATSTLDSQFWSQELQDEIRRANESVRKTVGSSNIRRIFFTPTHVQEYIKQSVQQAANARKLPRGNAEWEKIGQINTNLEYLANIVDMRVLSADSFKIPFKGFNPTRDELAIYDFGPAGSARVDVFKLDNYGQVLKVRVQPGLERTGPIHRQYAGKFDEAWNHPEALKIADYLTDVKEEMHRVESDIEYTAEWLHRFDKLVKDENPTLDSESRLVLTYLKSSRHGSGGRRKLHLDVGVCTGRYYKLVKEFGKKYETHAVDIDLNVKNFIGGRYPNLIFKFGDIRDAKLLSNDLRQDYSLITCMLGTCCHFGLSVRKRYGGRSGLAAGVQNMLGLLRIGGSLILSAWRQVKENRLLDIYTDKEVRRLLQDAPSEPQLREAVENALGKYELGRIGQTDQLDVYAVKRIA